MRAGNNLNMCVCTYVKNVYFVQYFLKKMCVYIRYIILFFISTHMTIPTLKRVHTVTEPPKLIIIIRIRSYLFQIV